MFKLSNPVKIKAKLPENTRLSMKVRHPFQVINISPYPLWIGFSLFWLVLYFGLFFLNAEWAKIALKETFFDTDFMFSKFAGKLNVYSQTVLPLYGDTLKAYLDIMILYYMEHGLFKLFIAIRELPELSSFTYSWPMYLLTSTRTVSYIIYPAVYWFLFEIWTIPLSIYLNFTWVMQASILEDVYTVFEKSEIVIWGFAKYLMPIIAMFSFGCPFALVTTGFSPKILDFIMTLVFAAVLFVITTIEALINAKIFIFSSVLQLLSLSLLACAIRVFNFIALFLIIFFNYLIYPIAAVVLIVATWSWMSDISLEGLRGEHTKAVQQNILWGAYLFMLTEIIIFATLFQTTRYFSINSSVDTCENWEFVGIHEPYSIGLGLANVVILLNSGWILQIARKRLAAFSDYLDYRRGGEKATSLICKFFGLVSRVAAQKNYIDLSNFFAKLEKRTGFDYRIKKLLKVDDLNKGPLTEKDKKLGQTLIARAATQTAVTIILGTIFMICQYIEYTNLTFSISNGVYGTCFYCLTGLHGFHVIVGLIMLVICYYQFKSGDFKADEALFFWFAARYWQFVDFVWVAVYYEFYYIKGTISAFIYSCLGL